MSGGLGVLLIIAIVVFVIIALVHQYKAQQKRTADLAAIADQLGFAFTTGKDTELTKPFNFALFSRGGSRHARDVLSGNADGTDVWIFDYAYTESHGESTDTYRQTVMLLRWPQGELPAFMLQPEGLMDRLGHLLGYNDINFETHPEFSRRYKLKGKDEPAIRAAFSEDVLSFYESKDELTTSVAGNSMIFYRASTTVKPEAIADFYADGWTAYALLRKLAAPTATA